MGNFGQSLAPRPRHKIIIFVTPTFKPVDRILWCYHLNKTFLAELLHSDVYF